MKKAKNKKANSKRLQKAKSKKAKKIKRKEFQPKADDFFKHVFLGEGQEDITEDLIPELLEKGFSREYIYQMKERGAKYSRPRGTFIFPPEIG